MYKILKSVNYKELKKGIEFNIEGIEFDSRKIKDNYIFVAMIGAVVDGHDYIQKALDCGAKMIIVEKNIEINQFKNIDDVTFILVENVRKHLGVIASNYYDYPQNKLKIIGITGTNGKTTCSYILENILKKTARIGTTGNRILEKEFETTNTTPESLELIKLMAESVKAGVEYFIMEVSSHALEIGRVDMLKFDSAIFTNLTQDHLDFHKTMENYFKAKKKIFSMLKKNSLGIINVDDKYGNEIYIENPERYISVSEKDFDCDLCGKIINYTNNGMKIHIRRKSKNDGVHTSYNNEDVEDYILDVNLVGEYNLYNILTCIGVALSLGIGIDEILGKIQKLKPVPGRFETIKNDKKARIVVDFAHTDDGLLNVGQTLKKITENHIITVFGAGGDRDSKKRPKMAKAAAKFSDFIVVTSDNPRTEDPKKILNQIEEGLKEIGYSREKYVIIEDREKAIKFAVQELVKEGDSLLIAGKGHENYQIIGKEKIHFDDREVVKKYL